MKCAGCNKEFQDVQVYESPPWDRGDGVLYGTASYSSTPVCPHCGYNNSPQVMLKAGYLVES